MGRKGVSFGLLGFSRRRQKGFGLETGLALHTQAVKCTLSVGREVKTEIPGKALATMSQAIVEIDRLG